MTKSTIEIHHNKLSPESCKLLLNYLNKDNRLPFIQCQHYNISINNRIVNGCKYTFPSTHNIEPLWKEIQCHVPYITNAHLHIPGIYDDIITKYINYNSNATTDISNLILEKPWMFM